MSIPHILIADDYEPDIRLIQKAFELTQFEVELSIARDGAQALDFLHKRNDYAYAQTPDLILLDLHMPYINGWQVLEEVRSDEVLKCMPVIILTSQQRNEFVRKAYAMGANAFIPKPAYNIDQCQKVVLAIQTFWFQTAHIPR